MVPSAKLSDHRAANKFRFITMILPPTRKWAIFSNMQIVDIGFIKGFKPLNRTEGRGLSMTAGSVCRPYLSANVLSRSALLLDKTLRMESVMFCGVCGSVRPLRKSAEHAVSCKQCGDIGMCSEVFPFPALPLKRR